MDQRATIGIVVSIEAEKPVDRVIDFVSLLRGGRNTAEHDDEIVVIGHVIDDDSEGLGLVQDFCYRLCAEIDFDTQTWPGDHNACHLLSLLEVKLNPDVDTRATLAVDADDFGRSNSNR